jgi:hypothetical protein
MFWVAVPLKRRRNAYDRKLECGVQLLHLVGVLIVVITNMIRLRMVFMIAALAA